jgi:hypothetical protein
MPTRSHFVAVLVAALSLSSVAGAGAATINTKHPAKVTVPSLKAAKKATGSKTTTAAKTTSVAKVKPGGGIIVKPVSTGPVVAAISAYPTGGKGSGTEATCALWSEQLQSDESAIDDADNKAEAAQTLSDHVNDALDAGCFVIY